MSEPTIRITVATPDVVTITVETPDVLTVTSNDLYVIAQRRILLSIAEDTAILARYDGYAFNNAGSIDTVVATLPPSADLLPGWSARFRVVEAQTFIITTTDADAFRVDTVSTNQVLSAQPGACIVIEYQGSGLFMVVDELIGEWALDPRVDP